MQSIRQRMPGSRIGPGAASLVCGARLPGIISGWRFRLGLLTTVAACTLAMPAPAPAQCVTTGTTADCTGDLSGGVLDGVDFTSPPVDTINVFDLLGDIAPAVDVNGLQAATAGAGEPLTITVDTGTFQIVTQGFGAGLGIDTTGDNSPIAITASGAINASREAFTIDTFGLNSGVTIVNSANLVSADDDPFEVDTRGDNSPIVIRNTGDLVAGDEGFEVRALNFGGDNSPITIFNSGSVIADDDAFEVSSDGTNSPIRITNTGTLASTSTVSPQSGIEVDTDSDNSAITIINSGPITSFGPGFEVRTDGANSPIIITNSADVVTSGATADGILAFARDATSTVTVNLLGGLVQGSTGDGDGVDLDSVAGVSSTLNVSAGATVTTLGDHAVEGGVGDETVSNAGTITGTVDLDTGTNIFDTLAGGVFNAGATVNLGAGNPFGNAGTLSPGGTGTVQTTALTGDFTQTASGDYRPDLDLTAGTADLFAITGTAALDGTVMPNLLNPTAGTQAFTILTATGGVTDNGLALGLSSPAVTGALSFPGLNDVALTITVDFTPDGVDLDANQTAIAETVSAASGSLSGVVDGLVNGVDGVPAYLDALDQLSPQVFASGGTATLLAVEDFADSLFSCEARRGGDAAVRDGGCFWVRPEGRVLSVDADDAIGFDETAVGLSAGAQVTVAEDWLGGDWIAGFALGYESADLTLDTGASSDSDRYSIGASLKYQSGPWLLATALAGGVADYDTRRPIAFGGVTGTATSDHDIAFVAGQARLAYRWEQGDWTITPQVDLNWTYLDRDDITESGSTGAELTVEGDNETFVSVTPAVEVGFDQPLDDDYVLRPYLRAGVSVFTDDDRSLTARFAGAPAGVSAFTTTTEFDQVLADIEAGVVLFAGDPADGTASGPLDRAVLTLGYDGRIAADTRQHGGFLRVAVPF